MNRSSEIINIFYQMNLPVELSKIILNIEKQDKFNDAFNDWIEVISKYKKDKMNQLFYKSNRSIFKNEIKLISGNFKILRNHKKNMNRILKKNEGDAILLNSFRF